MRDRLTIAAKIIATAPEAGWWAKEHGDRRHTMRLRYMTFTTGGGGNLNYSRRRAITAGQDCGNRSYQVLSYFTLDMIPPLLFIGKIRCVGQWDSPFYRLHG